MSLYIGTRVKLPEKEPPGDLTHTVVEKSKFQLAKSPTEVAPFKS
jgi:hypothetical protein